MHTLTKKTTILFSPDLYRQLETLAEAAKTSVGSLIRQAVVQQYFLAGQKRRRAAVEALRGMKQPTGSWQEMEQEAIQGRFGGETGLR